LKQVGHQACRNQLPSLLLRTFDINQGPRRWPKNHKHPRRWYTGIILPALDVSMASSIAATSSISGLLSGFASQHLFITLARELGPHLGISGLRFCSQWSSVILSQRLLHSLVSVISAGKHSFLPCNCWCNLWEAGIRIRHITTIYLPEANTMAINITFSVVGVAI